MTKLLEAYPVINDEILKKINTNVELKVYYSSTKEKKVKISKDLEKENTYYIDDNGTWNPDNYDFVCDGNLNIYNLNCLFVENKIVDNSTTIGIAINVVSKVSKINYTIELGEFNYGDNNISFPFNFTIEKKRLRQNVELEFFFFVKKVKRYSLYCSVEGSNLGIVQVLSINIEGNGSIFPILYFNDTSKPLWNMSINYEDYNDVFSIQTICIKINKSHKDFNLLKLEDISSLNYCWWKEMLGSFFITILLNAKDDFDNIINCDYEDGTIGCFISYIIGLFKIDKPLIENSIELSSHIRYMLDKMIK